MKLLKTLARKMGYSVTRIRPTSIAAPFSDIEISSAKPTDLDAIAALSTTVPGMLDPGNGRTLYTLCYFQKEIGDVVEIGSWQGRSTSFLARAAMSSGNGKMYAVDHFKGNIGSENQYRVGKSDLSDLEGNFRANMDRLGLDVTLLNMPNIEAAEHLKDAKIRFLFIDGDHSDEGVRKDIALFAHKVVAGGVIVFDDYAHHTPWLVKAVDELLSLGFSRVMTQHNQLIMQR